MSVSVDPNWFDNCNHNMSQLARVYKIKTVAVSRVKNNNLIHKSVFHFI